jgi:putative ABC transport system ATP-binding protein
MTILMRDIVKTYVMGDQEVHALRGVSLDVADGDLVAIMGPSGSGKSTLMNMIGCLDQPSSGVYELDGVEVSALTDDELAHIRNRKIGFVFQSYNLLARMAAIEQVELPLMYAGVSNRRALAAEALTAVGLGNRMMHKPTELSGGQAQRVAIARALVTNPSLILADEPTGALDTRSSVEIMALFQQLNQERGLTVVFVTHEPDVAAFTRRTLHIRDGLINSDEVHEAKHADPSEIPALGEPAPASERTPTREEPVAAVSAVDG